jgi:hypothetical protein
MASAVVTFALGHVLGRDLLHSLGGGRLERLRDCIRTEDKSPFFIGGMWDVWHAREEDRLYTFTVLTTFPNEVSGIVHDRMPVIVQPKDYQRWLDLGQRNRVDKGATRFVPGVSWVCINHLKHPRNFAVGRRVP